MGKKNDKEYRGKVACVVFADDSSVVIIPVEFIINAEVEEWITCNLPDPEIEGYWEDYERELSKELEELDLHFLSMLPREVVKTINGKTFCGIFWSVDKAKAYARALHDESCKREGVEKYSDDDIFRVDIYY